MRGEVHSINVSDGGVPKSRVESANIMKSGVEGDFNRFRSGRGGSEDRAVCIFSCLLYTSPSPRDGLLSRMPSSA